MITLDQFIARLESMKEIEGITGDTPVTVIPCQPVYEMFETAAVEVEHVRETGINGTFVRDIRGEKNTKSIIKVF